MARRERRATAADGSERERARRGRLRAGAVVLAAIAALLAVEALVGDRGLLAMRRAEQDRRMQEATLNHIRLENERLREDIRRIKDDPARLEELARQLGLIRPGETLFVVKDVPKTK